MKKNQADVSSLGYNSVKSFAINNIVPAFLSGLLFFLSFPKYGFGFIAWIAFIPFFFALKNIVKFSQGLLLGFITGIVGYIGIIYWIAYVIVNYGYLPLHTGVILMLLLAGYLSIYISIFAGCIVFFRDKLPLYLTAPVLWVCLEYIKSFILTGFPWENLGYSQYLNLYLIQVADVVGIYGLSFMIILINSTVFEVIDKKSGKAYIAAGVAFSMLAGIYIYGVYRMDRVNKEMRNSPDVEVSLIQGNIDQSVKWDKSFKKETLNIYEQLSLKNSPGMGSLIVWPETAVPFRFQNKNDLHDQIVNLSLKAKSWLIFGSISSFSKTDGNDIFNSAYLLSPSGEIKGRYDKVHLVPYGEYVPLRNTMPFIDGFTAGIGDFSKGAGFYPLSMNNRKIGILICYEAILPYAAREYKNNSAELLVNITNDAWFGATSAPFQHFSMAVLRAVETRLYLVRAANTGISGIIDPTGRIMAKSNIFQKDALKGNVKFVKIPTVYDRVGDIIIIICFAFVTIYFLLTIVWRKRCR